MQPNKDAFVWVLSKEQKQNWAKEFKQHVQNGLNMTGEVARAVLTDLNRFKTSQNDLAAIWVLADQDKDQQLSLTEFLYARFLIHARENGAILPGALPQSLIDSVKVSTLSRNSGRPTTRREVKTVPAVATSHEESPRVIETSSLSKWEISKENAGRYIYLFQENAQPPSFTCVSGATVLSLFSKSGLQFPVLQKIWTLADQNKDSVLVIEEFLVSLHLLAMVLKGGDLPDLVPTELLASASKHVLAYRQQGNLVRLAPQSSPPSPLSQSPVRQTYSLPAVPSERQGGQSLKAASLGSLPPLNFNNPFQPSFKQNPNNPTTQQPPLQSPGTPGAARAATPPVHPNSGAVPLPSAIPHVLQNSGAVPLPSPHVLPNSGTAPIVPNPSASPLVPNPAAPTHHQPQTPSGLFAQIPPPSPQPRHQPFPSAPVIPPLSQPLPQPAPAPIPSPTPAAASPPMGRQPLPGAFQPFKPQAQPAPSSAAPPPKNPFSHAQPLNIDKVLGQFNFRVAPKELPVADVPRPNVLPADYEKDLNGVPKLDSKSITREVVIGTGAFSSVWKGTWNGQIVAIKDVNYHNEREIEMWRREVQILGLLPGSDFLVSIKGYCVTTEHLTIVMEYMEQGSLFDLIHKKRNVEWSMLQKVCVLKHIARGLHQLHQLDVIHRDVKSMNILVDANSKAKLADLGCSRILERRNETMTIGIGTPLWMAPEIFTGNYSFSNDIFGFGVIIFELLNEILPDYDQVKKIVIIPTESIGYNIIKECIRKNPEHRPTASQLINSFDTLIRSFSSAVAHLIRQCGDAASLVDLPSEENIPAWFNLLLAYDRTTFDVLLSKALSS